MTENYYTTETFDKQHNHFGGKIYLSDFNTDYKGKYQDKSSIAKRIISDWKIDECCKKNTMR